MTDKNQENKFQSMYRLFEEAKTIDSKKFRLESLLIYKRERKQSWETLGATREQAKELDKWSAYL